MNRKFLTILLLVTGLFVSHTWAQFDEEPIAGSESSEAEDLSDLMGEDAGGGGDADVQKEIEAEDNKVAGDKEPIADEPANEPVEKADAPKEEKKVTKADKKAADKEKMAKVKEKAKAKMQKLKNNKKVKAKVDKMKAKKKAKKKSKKTSP